MSERSGNYDFAAESSGDYETAVARLSRDVSRDFYGTFRLAQGNMMAQGALFGLLGAQHRVAGHDAMMQEALQAGEDTMRRMEPPVRHKQITDTERNSEGGFADMWLKYADKLAGPVDSLEHSDRWTLLTKMVETDRHYQLSGRPGRSEDDDVHQSVLREYVLKDGLRGSPELLAVRDDLRTAIYGDGAQVNREPFQNDASFQLLAAEWEANHPDETFIPPIEQTEDASVA